MYATTALGVGLVKFTASFKKKGRYGLRIHFGGDAPRFSSTSRIVSVKVR